jgi:rubrerythrin
MNVEKYIEASEKLDLTGLDLAAAAAVGLSDDERFILTYFADIESQTIIYLRDLLRTDAALEPEVTGFLAAWNYEEYFHGRAISRLLAACGDAPSPPAAVRGLAKFSEKIEAFGGALLSRFFRRQFPALYMTWGAINELTTLRGYERIAATTRNPVVRELCLRIAKQERRHFAFYFNSARQRLGRSRVARWLTRTVLRHFWSPVGAGVKSATEVARLVSSLFPGEAARTLAESVDGRIAELPGLDGIDLMRRYTRSLGGSAKLLPWPSARIAA